MAMEIMGWLRQNAPAVFAGRDLQVDSRRMKPGDVFIALPGALAGKSGDGRDYIVSYNDCCGKSPCGRCLCNRNEGDGPIYRPPVANDYNWCVGSKSNIPYHCTVSRIVGVAEKAAG